VLYNRRRLVIQFALALVLQAKTKIEMDDQPTAVVKHSWRALG
jgi:hypothetical protein